ncbi:hypothetical protein LQZ21_02215 [Treponema sp. TIM-1]|uniref:hypothetical protein n=1 Tax=Treponema sp. TIM-1 TaxID=2898417 RepID=UPI00397EF581
MGSLVFLIVSVPAVFGRGKTQEEPKEPLNTEWTLCISALDITKLPPGRQFIGDILARDLVYALNRVERRERSAPEYAYYEGAAWSKSRTEAAKSLTAKRNERDLLLFKGEPDWKYRSRLEIIEEEIKKLEQALKKTEEESPPIAVKPAFILTEANLNGSFPPPPQEGGEYSFCVNQKADALLLGEVFEYFGRINLSLKLYTLYARSFIYEDTIIFSPEDINSAMTELANRLAGEVSGTLPAMVAVKTDPEDALIMIQNSFAGLGKTDILEYPPGEVIIEAFAENYGLISTPLELNSGELTDLTLTLPPTPQDRFDIRVSDTSPQGALYRGALFLGEPPLSMMVPKNQYEYIWIETPGGSTDSMAFSATPNRAGNLITLKPSMSYLPGENQVETARHKFYGAWGRFWIALPLTVLLYGISTAYAPTVHGQNPGLYPQSSNVLLHNTYFFLGAFVTTGFFIGEWLYRTYGYISTASEDAVPLLK